MVNLKVKLKNAQQELRFLQNEENTVKKDKKVLHIIPHSHTDEGWLSTTEDFYSGDDETSIYIGSVKDILDTTIQQLRVNKNHTFAYSEIKYFKYWWDQQEESLKKEVKEMVKDGRLDLVSGGWSAPDEATTTHDNIIDNLMIG